MTEIVAAGLLYSVRQEMATFAKVTTARVPQLLIAALLGTVALIATGLGAGTQKPPPPSVDAGGLQAAVDRAMAG